MDQSLHAIFCREKQSSFTRCATIDKTPYLTNLTHIFFMFGTIVIVYIILRLIWIKSKMITLSRFLDESNPNYNTLIVALGVRMSSMKSTKWIVQLACHIKYSAYIIILPNSYHFLWTHFPYWPCQWHHLYSIMLSFHNHTFQLTSKT